MDIPTVYSMDNPNNRPIDHHVRRLLRHSSGLPVYSINIPSLRSFDIRSQLLLQKCICYGCCLGRDADV